MSSRAPDGPAAPEAHVKVQHPNAIPGFAPVGLADTQVRESRQHVRAVL